MKEFQFLLQLEASAVIKSIGWVVRQFTARQASETLMHQMMTHFPTHSLNIIWSEDGERHTTYLGCAIELGAPDDMLRELFQLRNPYPWNNLLHKCNYKDSAPPRNILDRLLDSKSEAALQLVLDQILFGFDQHNQVRMGKLLISESSWRVTPETTSSSDFTIFLCRLISQYPQLAEDFLYKIGAVKTFVGVDVRKTEEWHKVGPETVISLKCCLPHDGDFLVAGNDLLVPRGSLWGDFLSVEVTIS